MQVDNYIRRVFPLEEQKLLKNGSVVEHPTTNDEFSEQIKIDLKSLEDYAQVKIKLKISREQKISPQNICGQIFCPQNICGRQFLSANILADN